MLDPDPRGSINPPRGRRPWLIPGEADSGGLCYLAWGRRRYGDDPIPVARQAGHVYFLVLRGTPVLRFEEGEFSCTPGLIFILHPARPMGWIDRPGSVQEILCWIWKHPPEIRNLRPARGEWLHWHLPAETMATLQRLHRATRNELARADQYSPLALGKLQTELDIELARSREIAHADARARLPEKLRLALDWIEHHPASTRPVADLCDRLEMEPSNLARLFRRHLGRSPQDIVNEHKIRAATWRLQAGDPVKNVALDLGYRHIHDFSRFYRLKTGNTPSSLRR
ncbi:DNA-binding domain-containing protein, AraC-type [Opitutaceae bacterium TAV1]|nr:DNA-binding domain-containing protein, AraC-type [Opitutaceae bacterium TAV1]